jgi:hypothetical protein
MLEVSSSRILAQEAGIFNPLIISLLEENFNDAQSAGEYFLCAMETRFNGRQFMGQKKIGDLSVRLFANRFRYVSSYAIWSLRAWLSEEIPLVLYHRIPGALEVLTLQAQGKRCVSALYEEKQISNLILGKKDYLDFFLHDLEHAYKFYYNNQFYHGQVGFYKLLLTGMKANFFSEILASHLKDSFEYVISDMNSHPVHLMKCLKMIMLKFFEEEKMMSKLEFLQWYDSLLNLWNVGTNERLAFFKLNENDFHPTQDGKLLEAFFLL